MRDQPGTLDFLAGGGAVGERMRALDWSSSPLGPPEHWPQSLRSVVGLLLNSKFPMFVAWGPELGFLYNDPYAEILGRKHPAALGARFYDIWSEIWADISPLIDAAMAGRASYRADLPLTMNRHGHDEQTWFTFSYSPVRDESGAVAGMFCACTETTAKVLAARRAEELLRLDERLRDIADTADLSFAASQLLGELLGVERVGYGVIDPDAGTIVVERNWSAEGFTSVVGHHAFADYGSYLEDLRYGRAVANNDIASDPRTAGHVASFEALGIRAFLDVPVIEAGELVAEMFLHSQNERAWSDEEIAFVGEFARRTHNAIARRQSEARYKTLFETIDEGFCVIEFLDGPHGPLSDYVHIEANPAYEANAGIAGIVGLRLREIVSQSEADAWAEIYRRVLVSGEPVRFERTLAETGRHLELAAFRVEPAVKRQVAVLFKDVTERQRAEQALRQLNETLEARVAAAIAEHEEIREQLAQAHKVETIGQLTGGIAHDFNNMLTVVSGNIDMARRHLAAGDNARADKAIANAIKGADSAAALTRRLLAFARRQPLDPQPLDVGALIDTMSDLLLRTIGEDVRLVREGQGRLPPVLVDPSELESAILNLALNARDAMPEGGVLTISADLADLDGPAAARLDLSPGPHVTLSVADTGSGMTREIVERALEPFFTTKGAGQGSGLGLSIVHGFVKQSGGSLDIASVPGRGTAVRLLFSVAHGAELGEGPNRPVAASERSGGAGETVLLVEDHDDVAELASAVLGEAGFRVIRAANGDEAAALLGEPIDLLFSDIVMPGATDGLALARMARARRPDLPILLATGYSTEALERRGIRASGFVVIDKPYRPDELVARVRAALDAGAAAEA